MTVKSTAPKDLSFDDVGNLVTSLVNVLDLVSTRFGWMIPAEYREPLNMILGLLKQVEEWIQ